MCLWKGGKRFTATDFSAKEPNSERGISVHCFKLKTFFSCLLVITLILVGCQTTSLPTANEPLEAQKITYDVWTDACNPTWTCVASGATMTTDSQYHPKDNYSLKMVFPSKSSYVRFAPSTPLAPSYGSSFSLIVRSNNHTTKPTETKGYFDFKNGTTRLARIYLSQISSNVQTGNGFWYYSDILDSYNLAGKKITAIDFYPGEVDTYYFDNFRIFLRPYYEAFRLPLPGAKEWYLTVEVGGEAYCDEPSPDPFHAPNKAYWSLDFAARSKDIATRTNPWTTVPILAAMDGKVIAASYTPSNGNYVRIDHDAPYNGTGLTTYYLHLRDSASSLLNQTVKRGDQLGIMGTTGISTGVHLHFQFKYNGDSTSAATWLQQVRLEGMLLESYKVGCRSNVPPTGFYVSGNTSVPVF